MLSSGRTLPRSILASIFAAKQEEIISIDSDLENQGDTVPPSERPVPNPQQNENRVAIALINFPVRKVSVKKSMNFQQRYLRSTASLETQSLIRI